ncbi:MFS transporter [Labrys sp. KNU-23]|uniref:MFS transporter n=1 Tax=Labrys sp. KNU-23 TaxID=2789216 RepID=UPI0011EE3AD0|nr:MFS transporter [Labrys sp. KNU-23]QEN88616.1 MFS transporter [Labrys sp. KNU-23]
MLTEARKAVPKDQQRSVPHARAQAAIPLWAMLAALSAVAAMSQAFRTVATLFAGELKLEFGASTQEIGLFAGAFHLSFALAQIPIGVALDLFGPRRTVCAAFLLACLGALVSALAPNLPVLIASQVLIGIGCAPAFLGAIVFVTNRYPARQFARLSGLVLSFSGIGMLMTGTPLALVVETWSWRAGFLALAAISILALAANVLLVRDEAPAPGRDRPNLLAAFAEIGPLLAQRHTLGILLLGGVSYAAFLTLRGLWAVPMLMDRHGFGLVVSGHIMLATSLAALLGPPVFGLLKPGNRGRRYWIVASAAVYIAAFAALAGQSSSLVDVAAVVLLGFMTGYFILQYADVRAAYAEEVVGRAFAVFNTAIFLGVAVMQWLTGLVGSFAAGRDADPFLPVFAVIIVLLAVGIASFVLLPWPRGKGWER